jgi:hypothetical protein
MNVGDKEFETKCGKCGKQKRKRMYNVTLRRVRATTVAVEKQYILHILSVCL